MDLLLVLLSAMALLALGLVADRVDRDLRGGSRGAGRADRTVGGDRPMRLSLLPLSPAEFAHVGLARVDDAARVTPNVASRGTTHAAPTTTPIN